MKRLIVCCDGTWNDADQGSDFTNVSRLAWAIEPVDQRDGKNISQIVYYQSGVGSGSDLIAKAVGGGVGAGLSRNVRDAYSFLSNNYSDGDEIFLFGFSRGAYTARSIGGLIGYAGLLHKRDMDRFANLWEGYRLRSKTDHPSVLDDFKGRHRPVRDQMHRRLGYGWRARRAGRTSTACSRASTSSTIPISVPMSRTLSTRWRSTKRATRSSRRCGCRTRRTRRRQTLKQVWFAGVHSNVGGGYGEHGLSDITLAWMASEIDPLLAIDYQYLKDRRDLRNDWKSRQALRLRGTGMDAAWDLRAHAVRAGADDDKGRRNKRKHSSKRGYTCEGGREGDSRRLSQRGAQGDRYGGKIRRSLGDRGRAEMGRAASAGRGGATAETEVFSARLLPQDIRRRLITPARSSCAAAGRNCAIPRGRRGAAAPRPTPASATPRRCGTAR